MNITVCIRRLANGEINPFDASAYEAALRWPNARVTLLSMGPMAVEAFLVGLTRLGADRAILLSDSAFAGADTLATAYTLSAAIRRLAPDLIFCGRQAIDGDTGQVGPEIAAMLSCPLVTNVMKLENIDGALHYQSRYGDQGVIALPSLITFERIYTLRLPRIRSKAKQVEVWSADTLALDKHRCGLIGSPTRVVTSFQNEQDRRKCTIITPREIPAIMQHALETPSVSIPLRASDARLSRVWIIGESPRKMAETISDDISMIPLADVTTLIEKIRSGNPSAVLWGSDPESKRLAPQVAARLQTGLCADCTQLETDGELLFMYRPAFSGNIIAKIKCMTQPPMATVRTAEASDSRIALGIGYGAKDCISQILELGRLWNAEIVSSRKIVDHDYMPYETQVGLTGKTICPEIYLAFGVSGAVHHIAGIKQSGIILAVNPDKDADIFKYADYGIIGESGEALAFLCQSNGAFTKN